MTRVGQDPGFHCIPHLQWTAIHNKFWGMWLWKPKATQLDKCCTFMDLIAHWQQDKLEIWIFHSWVKGCCRHRENACVSSGRENGSLCRFCYYRQFLSFAPVVRRADLHWLFVDNGWITPSHHKGVPVVNLGIKQFWVWEGVFPDDEKIMKVWHWHMEF